MPSLWSRTNAWLGVVSDPAQARALGGHGGMDFIMNYRLIQCMRDGAPPDMDVKHAPCTPHGTGTADFALFTLSRQTVILLTPPSMPIETTPTRRGGGVHRMTQSYW